MLEVLNIRLIECVLQDNIYLLNDLRINPLPLVIIIRLKDF